MSVHVDDIFAIAPDLALIEGLHSFLSDRYKQVTMCDGTSHLGLSLERDPIAGTLKITQQGLLNKLFEELGLDTVDATSVPTPAVTLSPEGGATSFEDKGRYQKVVGMLLYLVHSRPDICYAVTKLSTRSHDPMIRDWQACKRCARYLLGTRDLGIIFRRGEEGALWLHGYADASFANHDDARSHTGLTFSLAPHSAPIFSSSKRQGLVAQSSTESELEALKSAGTFAAYIRPFLEELGYSCPPAQIFEDNAAALLLVDHPGNWGRTRHFAVRYQYVKSLVEDHTITLAYVPTSSQVADIFTKPLSAEIFTPLRDVLLGITPSPFILEFISRA
jgi:hypothetical protein